MAKRDYYEVLGVSKDSSAEQIKKSYRQLALKYHPDRNSGNKDSEELFKEASEAYQVLSDDSMRSKYDRFGHAAFNGGGFDGFGFGSVDDIFGDLFSAFFGGAAGTGRSSGARARAGRDLRYAMEITLEESALGIEKTIKVKKPVPCSICSGKGTRGGKPLERCKQCGGSGQIRTQQGFFSVSRTCAVCRGEGKMNVDPCPACSGAGQTLQESELSVKVPAGIDTGQLLKLRGEGETIPDGPPGDLYVEIKVAPHSVFERHESELVCEVPITYCQAVLGSEIEVPTLGGTSTLKIPPGTPSGTVFRLKGKGIMNREAGRAGDQHIRVYVYVPGSVDEKQRELLEQLSKVEGKPVAYESRSFFERVKEFFD